MSRNYWLDLFSFRICKEFKKNGSQIKYTKPEYIEAIAVSCEPDEA